MSVHFNPERPRVHSVVSAQGARPVLSTQQRHSFGDSLEIRSNENKSWFDCFKNCFQAIWDFIVRLFSKKPQAQEINKPVQEPNPAAQAGAPVEPRRALTLNDVDNMVILEGCLESDPCQHNVEIWSKDRRRFAGNLSGPDIWSLVSRYEKNRINISNNPNHPWGPDGVVNYFRKYAEPKYVRFIQTPEEVLDRIFANIEPLPPPSPVVYRTAVWEGM